MKKVMSLFFAAAMMFSITFIGASVSSNGNLSAQAQQTVRVRHRNNGVFSRGYRGGGYVVRKSWNGTKWVSRKVWTGTKWTGRKTWRISKRVASRAKKIIY